MKNKLRGPFVVALVAAVFICCLLGALFMSFIEDEASATPTAIVVPPKLKIVSTDTPWPTATPVPPTVEPTPSPELTATVTSLPTSAPTNTASLPPPCVCHTDLYNCSDGMARRCFAECMGLGFGDVHGLDRDGDGAACE
jgi:hypothetical protein